jgi:hypothetical protein
VFPPIPRAVLEALPLFHSHDFLDPAYREGVRTRLPETLEPAPGPARALLEGEACLAALGDPRCASWTGALRHASAVTRLVSAAADLHYASTAAVRSGVRKDVRFMACIHNHSTGRGTGRRPTPARAVGRVEAEASGALVGAAGWGQRDHEDLPLAEA